jgi:hypothetical protein
VLWFETDELVYIAIMMFSMMYVPVPTWLWLLVFCGGLWVFRKLKERYPRGFAKHIMYEAGFMNYKGYAESDKVDFYE